MMTRIGGAAARLLLAGALLVTLAPKASAQDPCAALARMRGAASSSGAQLDWDEGEFWSRLGYGYRPGYRTAMLVRHLWASEGGLDPLMTTVTPIRTGAEAAMYRSIKAHIAARGTLLGTDDLLAMGLAAVSKDGKANVQLAMLTVHNVVRVLARPEQWAVGTDPNDAMAPVFDDLRGTRSAGGGDPLPQLLVNNQGLHPIAARDPNNWGMSLFASGGKLQAFASLPGTTSMLDNAGSHYYYWTGAMGQAIGGDLSRHGLKAESNVKNQLGASNQGAIQVANAREGRRLSSCLEEGVTGGLREPPPGPDDSDPNAPDTKVGELSKLMAERQRLEDDCEIEAAVAIARQIEATYSAEYEWSAWYATNMANQEAAARGQARAREAIAEGQQAILAKDLDGAIGHLDRAQYAQDVPACLVKKILSLKSELELRRTFGQLTKEVADNVNDLCDFKAASDVVGKIAALSPRETYMNDWMNENVPKIAALQQRERDTMTQLATAQAAAQTAKTKPEWEAAILLLDTARATAPECVARKLNLDGLRLDWENQKEPPVESSIVLLVDTSGSMSENDKIGQARRAAEAAVRKASRSTEMAILAFDGGCSAGSTRVVHEFSTDANALMGALASLSPGGGTPMYIATGVAVEYAKKSGRGKNRTVVLMSDGGDSCRSEMANASAGIRSSNIPINTIGFDVGNNQQARDDLSQLSGMTRGRSLQASAKDPREIIRAFDLALLPSLLKSDAGTGAGGAVSAYFTQAKAMVAQQDIGGAVFQFQQAQKLAPDSAAVHFNLSLLQEANDQLIPAMNHARQYLKLAPSALDRADVENRVTNLAEELRKNPREMADPGACRDLYNWAQIEQETARRTRDPARRQAMLEILIASQRGDCGKAGAAADAYKTRYGAR